jgi:hypothetical protein
LDVASERACQTEMASAESRALSWLRRLGPGYILDGAFSTMVLPMSVKFELGYDSQERRVFCRFLGRPEDGRIASPPLRDGEPVGKHVEHIADALEAYDFFNGPTTRRQFIDRARAAFEGAGLIWDIS